MKLKTSVAFAVMVAFFAVAYQNCAPAPISTTTTNKSKSGSSSSSSTGTSGSRGSTVGGTGTSGSSGSGSGTTTSGSGGGAGGLYTGGTGSCRGCSGGTTGGTGGSGSTGTGGTGTGGVGGSATSPSWYTNQLNSDPAYCGNDSVGLLEKASQNGLVTGIAFNAQNLDENVPVKLCLQEYGKAAACFEGRANVPRPDFNEMMIKGGFPMRGNHGFALDMGEYGNRQNLKIQVLGYSTCARTYKEPFVVVGADDNTLGYTAATHAVYEGYSYDNEYAWRDYVYVNQNMTYDYLGLSFSVLFSAFSSKTGGANTALVLCRDDISGHLNVSINSCTSGYSTGVIGYISGFRNNGATREISRCIENTTQRAKLVVSPTCPAGFTMDKVIGYIR